ncbi:xanthine dehydrogenase family protein subunit M [Actinoplanes sp. NEAU-A12]|uniref:Xanthine dehydrogenase family protein subunit M n=1 Tax=Actinoplanes sandaracinus TaxID=3045177 RepID=A0ABT6WL48_9ACTN|nr:xanthine dehydrogenase family protein subunit M [Actinoplanes sandaracinus]MDI6100453.1 xanthine dehydrogenase family protein subunit M [Actinoplanes sandaracinus]
MRPLTYERATAIDEVVRRVANRPGAAFLAGGTTVVDLLKLDVITPDLLVDVRDLPLGGIVAEPGRIRIGATASNSDVAVHPAVRERCPVLAEALLAGASPQLRNMATIAGNLLQRTRCTYFRDGQSACNKREPGTGCSALNGVNRDHAVLGGSDDCIAVFPSDACTALAMLDTTVHTVRPDGATRVIDFAELHTAPGHTPHVETVLEHGELITGLVVEDLPAARRSAYLKVRDRTSYEFALASAAVALEITDGVVTAARIALGGVATRPWRSHAAEEALIGGPATTERFAGAAAEALAGARPLAGNAFKVRLAEQTLITALTDLASRPTEEPSS